MIVSFRMCIHSKIGTDRYNEYLKDLFTSRYYENMVPFEDDLVKEAAYGEPLWKNDRYEPTPYDLLFSAVVCQAVNDFMEAYNESLKYSPDHWKYGRCRARAEEIIDFMSKYEITESVLNELLILIQTESDTEELARRLRRYSNIFLSSIGAKQKRTKVVKE